MSKLTAFISLTLFFVTSLVVNDVKSTQFDPRYEGIELIRVNISSNLTGEEITAVQKKFGEVIYYKKYKGGLKIVPWGDPNISSSKIGILNYFIVVIERCSKEKQICVFDLRTDASRANQGVLQDTLRCDDVIFTPTRRDVEWKSVFADKLAKRFQECVVKSVIKFRARDKWYKEKGR